MSEGSDTVISMKILRCTMHLCGGSPSTHSDIVFTRSAWLHYYWTVLEGRKATSTKPNLSWHQWVTWSSVLLLAGAVGMKIPSAFYWRCWRLLPTILCKLHRRSIFQGLRTANASEFFSKEKVIAIRILGILKLYSQLTSWSHWSVFAT